MQEIFVTLGKYKDNGFNICLIPFSATQTRFDGGSVTMLKTVKALLSSNVITHTFLIITQLNRINQADLQSQCTKIKNELPVQLKQNGFEQMANIDNFIYYHHGNSPSGLEEVKNILPKFSSSAFMPQLDEVNRQMQLLVEQEKEKLRLEREQQARITQAREQAHQQALRQQQQEYERKQAQAIREQQEKFRREQEQARREQAVRDEQQRLIREQAFKAEEQRKRNEMERIRLENERLQKEQVQIQQQKAAAQQVLNMQNALQMQAQQLARMNFHFR